MTDLEELERLLEKARPGAWAHDSGPALDGTYHVVNDADENMVCECYDGGSYDEHNAALIVALRNAAPSLIATAREVEGLRAEVARLRDVVKHYGDTLCEGIGECVGDFCGKLSADECSGCFARAALEGRGG